MGILAMSSLSLPMSRRRKNMIRQYQPKAKANHVILSKISCKSRQKHKTRKNRHSLFYPRPNSKSRIKNSKLNPPSMSPVSSVVKHEFEQTKPIFYFAKIINLYFTAGCWKLAAGS